MAGAQMQAVAGTRHRPRDRARTGLRRAVTYVLLCSWGIVALFPLYWVVTTSIKSPNDIYTGPKYVPYVDFQPSNEGWTQATVGGFQAQFALALGNSALIAISAALLCVVLGSMAGYGLARFKYKIGPFKNKDVRFWFIAQIILPPATIIFPVLMMYKFAGLLDTQIGMILLYTSFNLPLIVWIMQDHFMGIPVELEESALVDGCSRVSAFFRISLPLAIPGVIAAYLLVLVFCWNEYFMAVNLTSANAYTMPILIANQSSGRGLLWWTMSAMATSSIAPMVIIGLILERYIVRGLTAGAVRG